MDKLLFKGSKTILSIIITLAVLGFVFADQSFVIEPDKRSKLQKEARKMCFERTGKIPPQPFHTDACTLWPNSLAGNNWTKACIEHDMEYWCGGSLKARNRADEKLAERVSGVYAYVMYPAVRLAGIACLPVPWRWGYGHNYPNGCLQ